MKYKLVKKANPQNRQSEGKWYPQGVNAGKVTHNSLAKDISGRSSLTRGDIENVLSNFIDELPRYLMLGNSVQLGDFGTLRLSISGEGVEDPKSFNASMISKVKIVFTPSTGFKEALSEIKFEKEQEKE